MVDRRGCSTVVANCPDARKVCIKAGDATDALDQQLVRRGAATLGVPRSSTMSLAGQVLPLFLSAIISPVDVRRVGERLNFQFQAAADDEPAQSFSIVPHAVAKKLLDALVEEPGITDDADRRAPRTIASDRSTISGLFAK